MPVLVLPVNSTALSHPAASMTARISSIVVSADGTSRTSIGESGLPDGLEPPTRTLGRCRSIQLSYGGEAPSYPSVSMGAPHQALLALHTGQPLAVVPGTLRVPAVRSAA